MDASELYERVKEWWEMVAAGQDENSGYYGGHLVSRTKLVNVTTASPNAAPVTTFSLEVTRDMCNSMNNMHGGCAATLFDVLTSGALKTISKPGFWEIVGVSRTLNVTYLRPVRLGMKVLVSCEVLGVGRRMATVRGVMQETKDGKTPVGEILCVCEHGKANIDPPKEAL